MLSIKQWCVVFFLGSCAALASAQTTNSPQDSAVATGRERFVDACAFCHGLAGKGNGMAAEMLEKQPADLTALRKNNDGSFPLAEVYGVIDGRTEMGSHGDRDMPVWGDVWRKNVPPEYSQYYVRGRILELVLYLESIQM